jgi:ABC-2 type transport system permease protein
MTSVIRAELTKLTRRRVLIAAPVAAVAFAAVATMAVFLSAQPAGGRAPGRATTIEELASAGGATHAFATGASFIGLLVFATIIANVTGEFSQGTFRTLLMREPGRIRLLAGKMTALLLFAAVVLLGAEALTVVASTIVAPTQGVSTSQWFTLTSLGEAAGDYARSLSVVGGWALLGMALGMVVRSTPVALGIGVAWAGPFEHLFQDAWSAASRWFPGLLLEALAVGGTEDVSFGRAAALLGAYVVVAAGAAVALFARRDVTA